MNGPLSFGPSVLAHSASWPRWWMWAVVGMTVSLSWSVPFIPWWAGLGSGLCAVLTLTILAFYARKQYEEKPLEGEEVLGGHDAKQVLDQVDALMSPSKDIEQIPQVDEVLQNMAAASGRSTRLPSSTTGVAQASTALSLACNVRASTMPSTASSSTCVVSAVCSM